MAVVAATAFLFATGLWLKDLSREGIELSVFAGLLCCGSFCWAAIPLVFLWHLLSRDDPPPRQRP